MLMAVDVKVHSRLTILSTFEFMYMWFDDTVDTLEEDTWEVAEIRILAMFGYCQCSFLQTFITSNHYVMKQRSLLIIAPLTNYTQ